MNKNVFSINNYLISPPLGWSVLVWRVFCITKCVYQDSVLIILYNYRHVIECVQVCMHMCVRVHFLYGHVHHCQPSKIECTSLFNCVCVCWDQDYVISTRVPWSTSLRFLGHVVSLALFVLTQRSKTTWQRNYSHDRHLYDILAVSWESLER